MTPSPKPGIMEIDVYVPGRSEAKGAARVYKLSSNESPFGPSPKAIAAYEAAEPLLGVYPVDDSGEDVRADRSTISRGRSIQRVERRMQLVLEAARHSTLRAEDARKRRERVDDPEHDLDRLRLDRRTDSIESATDPVEQSFT